MCSVICPWTVIFSVIPGSHYAKCYSILSHCFLLHMKLFLWRLKTKKEKLIPYIAVHTTTASIPVLMSTCKINWSAGGPLLPKVKGGWLKNPLVNASIKTNYNLSLHVDLSPVCDLIIGSDKGPCHNSIYNCNILSRNQSPKMEEAIILAVSYNPLLYNHASQKRHSLKTGVDGTNLSLDKWC